MGVARRSGRRRLLRHSDAATPRRGGEQGHVQAETLKRCATPVSRSSAQSAREMAV